MEIVKYPDKRLLEKSEPVAEINEDIKSFIREMRLFADTQLRWGRAVGLAAPQVGRNIRIFLALRRVYINPEIVWVTRAPKNMYHEGCYSLEDNNFAYEVHRAPSITLEWTDINGERQKQRFNGFEAQVIQHEMDHLEGVTCVNKL